MFTPDSYNNDPAKIMRAELRAAQAEAREARKAWARSQSRSEAEERGRALLAQLSGWVHRRAREILVSIAPVPARPAERERRRTQCRPEGSVRSHPHPLVHADNVLQTCPGTARSLRLVHCSPRLQGSLLLAHLADVYSGGRHSNGGSRCPHQ